MTHSLPFILPSLLASNDFPRPFFHLSLASRRKHPLPPSLFKAKGCSTLRNFISLLRYSLGPPPSRGRGRGRGISNLPAWMTQAGPRAHMVDDLPTPSPWTQLNTPTSESNKRKRGDDTIPSPRDVKPDQTANSQSNLKGGRRGAEPRSEQAS